MQIKLQRGFEAIEQQRRAIETRVGALSGKHLTAKATPDTWNIQQIVEHLVLSDETVGRPQEANAVQSEAPIFRVLPRALRRALVLAAFKRDTVLPLPSPAVEPIGNVPLPELLERWEQARAEMRGVLETINGTNPRWSHPVLGPLTALQMLTIEEVHTAYHIRQIETLLSAHLTSC